MKHEVKNPDLQGVIRSVRLYGNLMLNDVPTDKNGKVIVKTEKERTDKKPSRNYYVPTFVSMENVDVARSVALWQSHTPDNKSLVWKVVNPLLAGKMLGGEYPGFIAKIDFNEQYEIDTVDGKRNVDKTTLYIPTLEVADEYIMNEAIRIGLIAKPETDTSEKHDISNITSGQGTDVLEGDEVIVGATQLEGDEVIVGATQLEGDEVIVGATQLEGAEKE